MASMQPGTHHLTLYQGDTFKMDLRLREIDETGTPAGYIDLTGYTGLAQIRDSAGSDDIAASFVVTVKDQVAERGGVSLFLAASESASLERSGVWDFQLTSPSNEVTTYLAGSVKVLQEVSR